MDRVSADGNGPRFLIADDHAMFAETLRVYLEKTYRVVGLVADGRAMVAEAMRLRPDVIVADVGMPILNGLDAARRIKLQVPNIKFIFLTMHDDPNLAAAALELGPIGFVLKHSTGQYTISWYRPLAATLPVTYQAHAMRSSCLRLNALLAAQIHVSPEESR